MALLLNDGKYVKISFVNIREFDDTPFIYFDIYENKDERELEKEIDGYISDKKSEDNMLGNILIFSPEGNTIEESLKIASYNILKSNVNFSDAIDC